MALLTNKLSISLVHEEFDARYDVFEVTKEGKGRLSWSSRVFEVFGAPYILSILGQGGDDPFYILAPKSRVSARGLRDHFENSYGGVIEDEDFEPADVATSLLPKQVTSCDVPEHILVQLLLNALFAGNSENGPSLQNVTGHLYCFKTGRDWVKKTKSGRNLHIIGLELKVTPESLLKVMRYEPATTVEHAIDPLSAILSLSDHERDDPRVAGEVENVINQVLGGADEGNR